MIPSSPEPSESRSTEQSSTHSEQEPWMQPEDAFTALSHLIVSGHPMDQVLTRAAELIQACVPGADEVTVTLVEGSGRASTAAFTGRVMMALDERQYEAGFGPCLAAAENGQIVRVNDTAQDATFVDFAAVAARQGVRNTISVGMPMLQHITGGINVYRFEDSLLGEDSVRLLQIFAGYTAIALANHSLHTSAAAVSSQLQAAMQSRMMVEQAKGMVMVMFHCSAEEAFKYLLTRAQHTHRTLRDVAADVIADV